MKPEFTHLLTPEGENLPTVPWGDEYPRPLLRRDSFFCLNGEWEFSSVGDEPSERILVPFVPESRLSRIGRSVGKHPHLLYRRKFTLPSGFLRDRVFLHFGAVDQIARVSLNGRLLGEHIGGYEPFSFEITDCLLPENTLEVRVEDRLFDRTLPYGKQREKRGGMWYTPISGIWQSVWLESTPRNYIKSIEIRADMKGASISVEGADEGSVCVSTPTGEITLPLSEGRVRIEPPEPILWTPETPHLYTFTVRAGEDEVASYFACREVSCGRANGKPRLLLNGKPYFFHGLLDQGYFSDGIFTPASPEGYTRDILAAKSLGFNMLRKHIKIEPERFYYDCDRLGMVVFQDAVNNSKYSFLRDTALPTLGFLSRNDTRLHRNPATREAFLSGMKSAFSRLASHPCVCYFTVFNEGWGQFCADDAYETVKSLGTGCIVDTASGWFVPQKSDVRSLHIYFRPVTPPAPVGESETRPYVLSEFGGYSCPVEEHRFNPNKSFGYRRFTETAAFSAALEALYIDEILPAVRAGLSAAVLTQLTDVEDETNGLLTYDRRVTKADSARMCEIAARLSAAVTE